MLFNVSSGSRSSATPLFGRQRHDAAGDVMRLAERHLQLAHQPVGEVGCSRIAERRRRAFMAARSGVMSSTMPVIAARHSDRECKRVERAFLVFLHVLE